MKKQDIKIDFEVENMKLGLHNKAGDCHKNARIVADELKKLGYDVRVATGLYINKPKYIKHSWIEYKDKILETDCRQLRSDGDIMPDKFCAVLDKKKFWHRYREMDISKDVQIKVPIKSL
jgi:hypothetical protein